MLARPLRFWGPAASWSKTLDQKGLGCWRNVWGLGYSPYNKRSSAGFIENGVRYRTYHGCYRTRGCAEADPGISACAIEVRGISAAHHRKWAAEAMSL